MVVGSTEKTILNPTIPVSIYQKSFCKRSGLGYPSPVILDLSLSPHPPRVSRTQKMRGSCLVTNTDFPYHGKSSLENLYSIDKC